MDITSAKVDTSMLSQRQAEFIRANASFQTVESVFNSVNFQYKSSEFSYSVKQFEQDIAETAYDNVQKELSRLRLKEKFVNNTDLVATTNINKHESIIGHNPQITAIEATISSNQAEIVKSQQELNTLKASPEIIKYEALSKEIKALQHTASSIADLIALKKEKGKDVSVLETKLDEIKKEIEKKEEERAELQPQYDAMLEVENKIKSLLDENSDLMKQRMDLDPELVNFNKFNNFFSTIIQGNGNGLGVESDLSKYRGDLSKTRDIYEDKSDQTTNFQELLNANLSIRNAVKSDLNSSKAVREQKETLFQISQLST